MLLVSPIFYYLKWINLHILNAIKPRVQNVSWGSLFISTVSAAQPIWTVDGDQCAFPFQYQGINYTTCITEVLYHAPVNGPWCMTNNETDLTDIYADSGLYMFILLNGSVIRQRNMIYSWGDYVTTNFTAISKSVVDRWSHRDALLSHMITYCVNDNTLFFWFRYTKALIKFIWYPSKMGICCWSTTVGLRSGYIKSAIIFATCDFHWFIFVYKIACSDIIIATCDFINKEKLWNSQIAIIIHDLM